MVSAPATQASGTEASTTARPRSAPASARRREILSIQAPAGSPASMVTAPAPVNRSRPQWSPCGGGVGGRQPVFG